MYIYIYMYTHMYVYRYTRGYRADTNRSRFGTGSVGSWSREAPEVCSGSLLLCCSGLKPLSHRLQVTDGFLERGCILQSLVRVSFVSLYKFNFVNPAVERPAWRGLDYDFWHCGLLCGFAV